MTPQFEVIPGILEQEWSNVEHKISLCEPFAHTLHIDLIDGLFVNNHTFLDPAPFQKYSADFELELHMMVKDPIQYIAPFGQAGFKRFLGHVEMMENQQEFINEAKKYGEAGLALDGPTALDAIKIPLESVDSYLIYTSEQVGFSGPTLLPERLEKVRELRVQTSAPIEVDGGINYLTVPLALQAGATRFAVTSFLFSNDNPQKQFELLKNLVNSV